MKETQIVEEDSVRLYFNGPTTLSFNFSDEKIIGGECSAPGIISLIASCNNKDIKEELELDKNSNVLLMGCEGNADENLYNQLLSQGMEQI